VRVVISSPLPTIQIDKSEGCTLVFADRRFAHNIVWSECQALSISDTQKTVLVPAPENVHSLRPISKSDQFITRFGSSDLVTEVLMREGNSGYATESEAIRNAERDRRNAAIARQFMHGK